MPWKVTTRPVNPEKTAYDTREFETLGGAMECFASTLREWAKEEMAAGNASQASVDMIEAIAQQFDGASAPSVSEADYNRLNDLSHDIILADGAAVVVHSTLVVLHV